MSECDHWKNWTMEQWQNAVYCEDCGLPMLEVEDGQNHGHYLYPYCTWTSDEIDILKTENGRLRGLIATLASEYSQTAIEPSEAVEWAKRWVAKYDQYQERLSLIYGLTFDRDGRATVEGLGELVDEVCRIAQGQYTFEAGTTPESEG